MKIKPFAALRPPQSIVEEVECRAYDVLNSEEARKEFPDLHVEERSAISIARRVMESIINENRGKYLYGDSLPGAIEFWRSLGAEFDEDEDEEYLTPFHINC